MNSNKIFLKQCPTIRVQIKLTFTNILIPSMIAQLTPNPKLNNAPINFFVTICITNLFVKSNKNKMPSTKKIKKIKSSRLRAIDVYWELMTN